LVGGVEVRSGVEDRERADFRGALEGFVKSSVSRVIGAGRTPFFMGCFSQ
jgi:hypothetical protein